MSDHSIKKSNSERIRIVEANLDEAAHQKAVLNLIDAYSQDPMGDGKCLSPDARERLISGLRAHPTTLIFLAYQEAEPIGIAVCFRGFSTFAARPLMNIHDLAVQAGHREKGVSRHLLEAVERKARALGCCKLTLEVLEKNERARRIYAAAGFERPVYHEEAGVTFFLSKQLTPN